MGGISRSKSKVFSRRAVSWVAAYALLLQTIVAPMFMARASNPDINQALLALCSNQSGTVGGANGSLPAKTHGGDDCCKLCVGGGAGFILGPDQIAISAVAIVVSVLWSAIENPTPDGIKFSHNRARGPPLLT